MRSVLKKKAGNPLHPCLHLKALVLVCFVTKQHYWSSVCSVSEKCLDQVKLCVKSFKTWNIVLVLGESLLSSDNICLLLY